MQLLKLAALIVLISSAASFAETTPTQDTKPAPKPTGACTISVYGVEPTCTSPMTEDTCNATASKVHGTAKWEKGKSCPTQ
jgi:hypothetical protein